MDTNMMPDRFTFKARAFARYYGYADKSDQIAEKANQMREAYHSARWSASRSRINAAASEPPTSAERSQHATPAR